MAILCEIISNSLRGISTVNSGDGCVESKQPISTPVDVSAKTSVPVTSGGNGAVLAFIPPDRAAGQYVGDGTASKLHDISHIYGNAPGAYLHRFLYYVYGGKISGEDPGNILTEENTIALPDGNVDIWLRMVIQRDIGSLFFAHG